MSECRICEYERQPPPGGWFFQTEHWSVGRHPTMEVPGWVVCQLRRHAAGLVDMSADELASMGPTLAEVARAITAETDAERVYFVSFGENHRHVHVVLLPRGPEVPAEHRSSKLHANSGLYADPAAAAETEARIRAALAQAAGTG
jgi:diadenosine tetraphosphate (Ap4A) HIT family hydrolase